MTHFLFYLKHRIYSNRMLLFDGHETDMPVSIHFKLHEDLVVNTTIVQLTNQFIDDLEHQILSTDFSQLITSSNVKKIHIEDFDTYEDEQGFDVYVTFQLISDKLHIIVSSMGEVQPSRFQLYLLACWEVERSYSN